MFRLVAVLLLVASPGLAADRSEPAVVIELFTSQSCDACPPADRLLGELAGRPDVVALTYNIDYWNYTGWQDTLASPANATRQRTYVARGVGRFLYTPQLVVAGVESILGSDRSAVVAAIERARLTGHPRARVELEVASPALLVHVAASDDDRAVEATVRLVRYSLQKAVTVTVGENAGRRLVYSNVVRDSLVLGRWHGEALRLAVDAATVFENADDGCAVIVQQEADGRILGAAALSMGERP